MSATRIASRFARTVFADCRNLPYIHHYTRCISSLSNPTPFSDEVATSQLELRHHSSPYLSSIQWFGFSSSASPQPNAKLNAQSGIEHESKANNQDAPAFKSGTTGKRGSSKRIVFSDSESDSDFEELSRDDLVDLLAEKEQMLRIKQEELEQMKDKVLRTLAEMENVKVRTRRESENYKKFAIQNFAKSLLDVADNLGRASSAAKESFSRTDEPGEAGAAFQQLKVLLQGVEMTEKQLLEVFRKSGLEKYDPINEEFDPNRHNAVFQVPDVSKPAGRVAVVLKAGYMLHDRVIRPAKVGVTVAADN